MLQSEGFPIEIKYVKCKNYNGSTSPERSVNLRSHFVAVTEPTTFGEFNLQSNPNLSFNGFSCLKFNMDISFVTYNTTEKLANWTAQLQSGLKIANVMKIQKLIPTKILKVSLIQLKPFIIKDAKSPKGFKGYCIDLLNEIASALKFDYEIIENKIYGIIDEKGKWTGIIRDLIDKKTEICLGPMAAMAERENVIEFTVPIIDMAGISIVMLRSPPRNSLFTFVTVFETNVWLYTLAVYLFTSFLMWLINYCSHYIVVNNCTNYRQGQPVNNFNFRECLWFCLASLTPQGGGYPPSNLSCRIIAATWFFYG